MCWNLSLNVAIWEVRKSLRDEAWWKVIRSLWIHEFGRKSCSYETLVISHEWVTVKEQE